MRFVLSQPVEMEESLTCEFKEVKEQPLKAVSKIIDEYVVAFLNESGGSIFWGIRDHDRAVTGLKAPAGVRDELKQVIGLKVAAIAPMVSAGQLIVPFHPVYTSDGQQVPDTCVLEVQVKCPSVKGFYLTGSGESYRRTIGGTKKLSGAEVLMAALDQAKIVKGITPATSELGQLSRLELRARLVASLIEGKRVLWVDDVPASTFYERLALSRFGLAVDVATTTQEGVAYCAHTRPAVVISDMSRESNPIAGLELLRALRSAGMATPVAFYIGAVNRSLGVPPGAFGIADQPEEILHLVLDALER